MDRGLSLVLPNAALRALTESFVEDSPGEPILELRIRVHDDHLNVREFGAYLGFLDGIYGRLDPRGFRSYARQPDQQLHITSVDQGSIDLTFLFDLLNDPAAHRVALLYLIAKVGPALLKGEVAKNWAEAAKATAEAYRTLRPPTAAPSDRAGHTEPDSHSDHSVSPVVRDQENRALVASRAYQTEQSLPVRLSRRQRKEVREFMRQDAKFARLSDRHMRELIRLVEDVLSQERHHLPAATRFSEKYVVEVSLRRRGRS